MSLCHQNAALPVWILEKLIKVSSDLLLFIINYHSELRFMILRIVKLGIIIKNIAIQHGVLKLHVLFLILQITKLCLLLLNEYR